MLNNRQVETDAWRGIQAVVFDLNGVLTTDMRGSILSLNDLYGVSMAAEALDAVWWPLYREASLGQIDLAEMWRRVGKAIANGAPPRYDPNRFFLSRLGPRESGLHYTVGQLRRHYSLGVMSNHVGEWARALLRRIGLAPMLDATLISSDVGMRKPAAWMYLRICEMVGVAPSAAVYVADEQEDLEAAVAVGMRPVFIPGEDSHSVVGTKIAAISELLSLLHKV
jgi:AHBA synthesis associated protein